MELRLYDRMVSVMVGTPVQAPAQFVKRLKNRFHAWRHPELSELENEERCLAAVYRHFIVDGMNCVDVGGHLGSVSSLMRRLSPSGRLHIVEPVAYKASWLRSKFKTAAVHQVAVSDYTGTAEFFVFARRSGFSGLRRCVEGPALSVQVPVSTLDALIPAAERVHFMKIDVEGAELGALKGASRILTRDRPVIVFECTKAGMTAFGYGCEAMRDVLNGYDVFLPKDAIDGPPLELEAFIASTHYPYKAFNFVARPRVAATHTGHEAPVRTG